MKKLLILLLCSFAHTLYGQSISIFDIDTSNFPTMKAKIYAFDSGGNQVQPKSSDLIITENGIKRTITNVSCPNVPRLRNVSVAMSIDISGSMGYSDFGLLPVELGKLTATNLCNLTQMPPSEFALQTCNSKALLIQDFTKDKSKILNAIPPIKSGGDNDFVEHLLNRITGLLNVAKTGQYKRVAVLYTDAWWYALQPSELKGCLDTCKKYNIEFYAIIYSRKGAEPNGIKVSLNEICVQTGGFLYDGITSNNAANDIANKIQKVVQGTSFCDITWESGINCNSSNVDLELTWENSKCNSNYVSSQKSVSSLKLKPKFISFGRILNPKVVDTIINITALNNDYVINDIKLKNGSKVITLVNPNFPIKISKNTSKDITLRFAPLDSSTQYAAFEILTDVCPAYFSATGGFPSVKNKEKTLKLIKPNGGETFVIGSDTLITWEGISESDNCILELSKDEGKSWNKLTGSASNLKFSWYNLPKPTSDKCLIKVKQNFNLNSAIDTVITLKGHSGKINSIAISNDGNKIVTGSDDNTSKIWDVKTGDLVRTIKGHTSYVNSIAISQDGNKIVTGSADNTAKIWDANTGTLIKSLIAHTDDILCVAISQDGNRIVTGSRDKTIKIWEANIGALIRSITNNLEVSCIVISPDGTKIISGDEYDNAKIWDLNKGTLIRTLLGHIGLVSSVAISKDGSKIVTGCQDKTAKIWDMNTGVVIQTLKGHTAEVLSVAISQDGNTIVTGSYDKTAKIWDTYTGNLIRTFTGHLGAVCSVALSQDGSKIVTGSYDNTAKIWDINEPEAIQEDQSDAVFSIVAPTPSSKDIDMKKCLLGSTKDSLVNNFVSNIGLYKFRVDSIYFTGADASAFSQVSGFPKFIVDTNTNKTVELRFQPKRIGIHQAKINVITQSDTLIQNITGEGVQQQIQVLSGYLDFGKVKVGKDTTIKDTIIIRNLSSQSIKIDSVYQLGPDKIQFENLSGVSSFILNPNESKKLALKFKALQKGRTSGQLAFAYNGVGSPAIVQLFGEGVKLTPQISTNSPICEGYDLFLFADSHPSESYHWYSSNGFKSNLQNPVIKNVKAKDSGKYYLYTTLDKFVSDTLSFNVEINTNLTSPGDSSLIFVGTATKENEYIKLTEAKANDGGSIWLKNRFSVKQNFNSSFQFRFKKGYDGAWAEGSIPGADGIAFVMQNHNYPFLGDRGGSMGYTGISNSLAIEFDLFKNSWDPNGNHIAVMSMGAKPNQADHRVAGSTLGMADKITTIMQDSIYYASIDYNWDNKTLKIFLDTNGKFQTPALTIPNLDLASYLQLEEGEYVYIGFTSGTGEAFEEHDLFNWTIPCKNQLSGVEDKFQKSSNEKLNSFPNPSANHIILEYYNEVEANVTLEILDIFGQKVTNIIDNKLQEIGLFRYEYDTSNLSEGIYFIVLNSGNKNFVRKLVVKR